MARGDAPKVKNKNVRRSSNASVHDEAPAKPPKGSFRHAGFYGIRAPNMRRLFRPGSQQKTHSSSNLKEHTVSEHLSNLYAPNTSLQTGVSEPTPALSSLAHEPDDSQNHATGTSESSVSVDHGGQSEDIVARTVPLPDVRLSHEESATAKTSTSASLSRMRLKDANWHYRGQRASTSDPSDSGSIPTQVLVMSHSPEILPNPPDSSPELQIDVDLSSGLDDRQTSVIVDLIQRSSVTEPIDYISPREMSALLDDMPGQVPMKERRSLQRSLSPFLSSSSSYLQIIAQATSSANVRSSVSRIYVSAWILRSLTESRLDGLTFSFIVHLAISTLPEIQRSAFMSKAAKLAGLAKDTWYADLATKSDSTRGSRMQTMSNQPSKSSLIADPSSLTDNRITPQLRSVAGPSIDSAAKLLTSSGYRNSSSNCMEMQPHNAYHQAMNYVGNTTEQLAGRLYGVWAWLKPVQNINNLQSYFKKEAEVEETPITHSKEYDSKGGNDTEALDEWVHWGPTDQHQLEVDTEIPGMINAEQDTGDQPKQHVLAMLYKSFVNLATTFVRS